MKSSRRGIVLISILILTLVATFFIGALVQMNPSRLRRTVQDENQDRAALAAQAGVDYALNRLRSDLDWKAEANDETVRMSDLVIREDNGNVLGWIKSDGGQWSGFRFRFNHQNGAPGTGGIEDDLNDPDYFIASEAISVNNLRPMTEEPAPLGDGPNNSAATVSTLVVPGETVALIVEGVVAPGLDPNTPATLAQAQSLTTRTIEGIYKVSKIHTGLDGDAVWCSGGFADFLFQVGSAPSPSTLEPGLTLESDADNTARIRIKGEMELARLDGSTGSSLYHADDNAEVLVGSLGSGGFPWGNELPEDPFLRIEYSNIRVPAGTPTPIRGGVYIFKRGNLDNVSRDKLVDVEYYDMSWAAYRDAKINGGPLNQQPVDPAFLQRVDLDAKSVLRDDGSTEKRDVITITKDVEITGRPDLTIIPERGARQKLGEDPVAPGTPVFQSLSQISAADYPSGASGLMQGVADRLFGGGPTASLGFKVPGGGPTPYFINLAGGNVLPGSPARPPGYSANGNEFFLELIYNGNVISGLTASDVTQLTAANAGVVSTGNPTEVQITNPEALITYMMGNGPANPAPFYSTTTGTAGTPDEFHIPIDPADPTPPDMTVPQDIEIHFEPEPGEDTAYIRSDGDLFLGTHVSGSGGGIISGGELSLIGFGVDLQASANSQVQEGLAIYGLNGVKISTYDGRKNKYYNIILSGAMYTEGDLDIRLGEKNVDSLPANGQPPWGDFVYEGAVIALGESGYYEPGEYDGVPPDSTNPGPGVGTDTADGQTIVRARAVSLFYDPKYLAPFLESGVLSPSFSPLSVTER